MNKLAVVIPAYKGQYFERALESLAQQTDCDFNLYIGDDNSPYNLEEISNRYKERLSVFYHQFKENLGAKDLVKQWDRCVGLMKDEKWIWLFSDDDIAEADCVAAFKKAIEETSGYYDVYRFNTAVIDGGDKIVSIAEESPAIENHVSLAYNILKGKRGNSMPDHIFKKEKYIQLNGFVNFAFAQASDWASSINFAGEKGLYTVAGPRVLWRRSGENISSLAARNNHKMIHGYLDFIEWIDNRFKSFDEEKYGITMQQIKEASISNLKNILKVHYRGIPLNLFFTVTSRVKRLFGYSFLKALIYCLKINYAIWKQL